LTPAEFTERYGPTQSDVKAVTAFLKAHDIQVVNVSANRLLIKTQASTATYEHALGILINDYRLDGRSFYSTADSPLLPRALAPRVTSILGLDHGVKMHPYHYFRV